METTFLERCDRTECEECSDRRGIYTKFDSAKSAVLQMPDIQT